MSQYRAIKSQKYVHERIKITTDLEFILSVRMGFVNSQTPPKKIPCFTERRFIQCVFFYKRRFTAGR